MRSNPILLKPDAFVKKSDRRRVQGRLCEGRDAGNARAGPSGLRGGDPIQHGVQARSRIGDDLRARAVVDLEPIPVDSGHGRVEYSDSIHCQGGFYVAIHSR